MSNELLVYFLEQGCLTDLDLVFVINYEGYSAEYPTWESDPTYRNRYHCYIHIIEVPKQ
jgi:hypothetical protein